MPKVTDRDAAKAQKLRIKVLENELEDMRVSSKGAAMQADIVAKATHNIEEKLETRISTLKTEHDRAEKAHETRNEKNQVTNEDLQATNDKLQTTNEELQASSEELQHINDELRAKTEEYRFISNELQSTKDALIETQSFLSASFDQALWGTIVIGSNGLIEKMNAAALASFGYMAEEIVGKDVKILMAQSSAQAYDKFINKFRDTSVAKTIDMGREAVGLRKNGEQFAMHLSFAERRIGDQTSYIGTITDLSDLKNMEKKLLQSQRMDAVGQLTGGIAHDFDNLLTIMIGNAESLRFQSGINADGKKNIKAIIESVNRAASLTQRLLSFSRQQALSPVSANISDLISDLDDMLQRTLGATIELNVMNAPDVWLATVDPHQFENALVNLAINASDAMPKGGELTIETSNETLNDTSVEGFDDLISGDYVRIAVSDTGLGMTPEVMEKVFEPFFTTKDVGEGSGLGLSMVHGFMKQSEGHITLKSEINHGTTINMYLPRSFDAVVEDKGLALLKSMPQRFERILVVEDDEEIRNISSTTLRNQGYEVVDVANGKAAINQLNEGAPFDLLFTDVVLPGGMDGVEIAAQAETIQPNIKILYTTGPIENQLIHKGDLVVKKPYHQENLLEKVRTALSRYTVLLMEDDKALLASLTDGLERADFSVTPVTGGNDGLRLLKSRAFDIIVSDIVMEEGEGIEALLWATKNIPDTPMIMMSGFPNYLKGAATFGAAAVLNKPINTEALVELILTVRAGTDVRQPKIFA